MACRVVVIKSFEYRGHAEEFSNEYTFTGATPADAAAWRTLFDALVLQEKTCYPSLVTVVAGYGYDSEAANAHAVWSVDMTVSPNAPVAGTCALNTTDRMSPGDCAVWVRWKTDRLNSRGKPVYLRKYFHGAINQGGGTIDTPDLVSVPQHTALLALGAKLHDGSFIDARVVKAAGHTDAIVNHGVSTYITTRTLKRRGKRPH